RPGGPASRPATRPGVQQSIHLPGRATSDKRSRRVSPSAPQMKKRAKGFGSGLGRLLLRGFRRRPRSTRRPGTAGKKATAKHARPGRVSLARAPARRASPPAVPATPPVASPTPATATTAHRDSPLTAARLLRPDERLRLSMEGFLLDQRSAHTRRAYGKDLKRFLGFLLSRRLERGDETLDRSVLIAYKESLLSEGLEHTTVDRHLATLRSFFRWLVDEGQLARNPAEGVRFLNPRRLSRTVGFTDDEVQRVLAVPNLHTRTGALHFAILMVLFYCGLRRSELCQLRTSNLGTERGQAVLRLKGKGNVERLLVVTPPVVAALKHYFRITGKDVSVDQYLFNPIRNNRSGILDKPMDPSMVFYIVTRYAKLGGVANRVSPHSCRATAISNARDHNASDRAIQEFAGWASPDMITRYDKRKSAIEKSAAHAIRYGSSERPLPEGPLISHR
ncbi:MAG: tyrosine-type recombinase/integrase, partial [Oligoflexia bacterium]|nr:tyrosine-type recombinase/integrase [Oligoflexia bacterium]